MISVPTAMPTATGMTWPSSTSPGASVDVGAPGSVDVAEGLVLPSVGDGAGGPSVGSWEGGIVLISVVVPLVTETVDVLEKEVVVLGGELGSAVSYGSRGPIIGVGLVCGCRRRERGMLALDHNPMLGVAAILFLAITAAPIAVLLAAREDLVKGTQRVVLSRAGIGANIIVLEPGFADAATTIEFVLVVCVVRADLVDTAVAVEAAYSGTFAVLSAFRHSGRDISIGEVAVRDDLANKERQEEEEEEAGNRRLVWVM